MKFPRLLWIPLGFLMFSFAYAQAPSDTAAKPWPHELSDLEPDPAVTWGKLDNGLRYAILPNAEPPDRVSLRLFVDAGSLMENEDQQGLAHFLEHMAFNGTTNFPAGEMVEYFQRLGMAFGSHTNAHTGFRETVYKLELPEAKPEILDEGFKLLRDYADGMLLGQEEVDRERGVILSEKRTRDSPDWRSFVDWVEFAFPDHKIGSRLPIGKEEVITEAPRERFVEFYNKWYTADRMVIVAVGDVETAAIEKLIKDYFTDLRTGDTPDPEMGTVAQEGVRAHYYSDPQATATSVSIETYREYDMGVDSAERREENLILMLASSMITRRLDKLSKQADSKIIDPSTHFSDLFDLNYVEYVSIDARCKPEDWESALSTLDQELRRALEYGFTDAELAEAKAKALNRAENQAKSKPTRQSRALADQIAGLMGSEEVFTDPVTDLERVKKSLDGITTERCLASIKAMWGDLDDVTVYASGNVTIEGEETAILSAYSESQNIAVEPPEEKEQAEFAYSVDSEPGEIVNRTDVEELGITQIQFANNVRANFKVTDFEKERVRVAARIGGGQLTQPLDKPGINMFASSTFNLGGLEAHSADDLQALLAGKTVGSGFSVDEDAFQLSGATTPDDLKLQLELMRAQILHPGYREEAAWQFEKQIGQLYQQLKFNPNGIMGNEVEKLIHSGDPRFGFPEQEILESRTMEEVKSWVDPQLEGSYLEVTLVGDFDLETGIDLVARTFGTMPEREAEKPAYTEARKVTFPTDNSEATFEFETEIPKSMSLIYWPTTDQSDIQVTRRLGMLSTIFRDRLRVKVREELGDAYSPYARNSSSEVFTDYGYLFGLVEAAPDQAAKVAQVIKDIGESLAKDGVTEDELDRAKKPLITMIEEYRRDNTYWMSSVAMRSQEEPERLEWSRTFIPDYKSITVEEMNELAATYLKPENALQVLILPK